MVASSYAVCCAALAVASCLQLLANCIEEYVAFFKVAPNSSLSVRELQSQRGLAPEKTTRDEV